MKRQMRTLDSSSMFSLVTTISPQLKQNISISSLEVLAKKPSLKRWITGQPTTQITYLAKKSPKKCWRIDARENPANLRDFLLETFIWLGYETGNRLCVDVHSAIKIV